MVKIILHRVSKFKFCSKRGLYRHVHNYILVTGCHSWVFLQSHGILYTGREAAGVSSV